MLNKKYKIHVKKGDNVKIISGTYKGKTGEIAKVIYKTGKVVIKNINIKTKHVRPKKEEEVGQIIELESPIHSSNVMLYSTKYQVASRYNYIINQDNKKQKKLKKTGEII